MLSGDDLRARRPCPGVFEQAQQTSIALLPRGDAKKPAEAAGETGPGGAAEDGPAAPERGGDGQDGGEG